MEVKAEIAPTVRNLRQGHTRIPKTGPNLFGPFGNPVAHDPSLKSGYGTLAAWNAGAVCGEDSLVVYA